MRARVLILTICVLALGNTALGHSLWIIGQGETVRVIFEHSPNPGEGTYNAPILANGKTWVRAADGKETQVALKETGEPGTLVLKGHTEVLAPRSIEHSCLFGIYHGRLDYFYGQYLDISTVGQLESLGRAPRLTLDIVPELKGGTLELKVLWEGKPLTDHQIGVFTPGGDENSFQTNDKGVAKFSPSETGIYGFWSIRLDDEPSGVYEGDKYSGTMHGTTLSLRWPLGNGGK